MTNTKNTNIAINIFLLNILECNNPVLKDNLKPNFWKLEYTNMETTLEHILTYYYKDEMISYMLAHREYFDDMIKLAISNKEKYSWRAAWLLRSCMEENDLRVQKHIEKIINSIESKNDGHQRELIKVLLQMELNEEQEPYLFNICMTLWEDINKKPSVRFTAFSFIIKIAKKYPDLKNEVISTTQNHYLNSLSPGIKNSILKKIRKLNQ